MVTDFFSKFDSKFANFSYKVENLPSGVLVNVELELLADLIKVFVRPTFTLNYKDKNCRLLLQMNFKASTTKNLQSGNYETRYELSNKDICRMNKKPSNFLEKFTLDKIEQFTSFQLKCPFKKVTPF